MTMMRRRMIMMLSGQRTIWTKRCEDNQEISVRLAPWSVFTVFTQSAVKFMVVLTLFQLFDQHPAVWWQYSSVECDKRIELGSSLHRLLHHTEFKHFAPMIQLYNVTIQLQSNDTITIYQHFRCYSLLPDSIQLIEMQHRAIEPLKSAIIGFCSPLLI